MEINLKDTLRRLRRKKNITQEALAAYLGITHQSVGKWERGEGFPDITMLPKIAFYFDVTVDELLDVGKSRIQEKIERYREESTKYMNAGENEKNLALWEEAYREFGVKVYSIVSMSDIIASIESGVIEGKEHLPAMYAYREKYGVI